MSSVLPGGSKRRSVGVLAVVGVLLAAAMVLELVGFPAVEPLPVAQPQAPPTEGIWYCPLTAEEGGSATLSVAAAGSTRSSISVAHYLPGRTEPGEVASLGAGEQLALRLDGERAAAPVAVRWEGGPVVATWQSGGQAAVPCAAQPSDRWYLTGLDTVEASSILHLLNPFDEDAAARVIYATPEGRAELTLTDDVVIEGGSVLRLDLRQYQPEVADLGVLVEVLSGRLVAAGEVLLDPTGPGGESTARVSLAAAPTPSRSWSFAFARVDDTASSWLSVMNPSDREAAVEVRVTDPKAAGMPAEVSIPPGGVERVDLAELSSAGEFAVALRSVNDVPVVAARLSALRGAQDLPALSGGLGAAQPATAWALAAARAGGTGATVGVFNPEGRPAAVSLRTAGASGSWAVLELPANGRVAVDLPAASDRTSVPMIVRADAPVVAELRSAGPGTESWTAVGVPERSWSGPPSRPEVRWDPGLSRTPAVRTEDP